MNKAYLVIRTKNGVQTVTRAFFKESDAHEYKSYLQKNEIGATYHVMTIKVEGSPELTYDATKFDQALLINKFYERYPLSEFKNDSKRAEALGYFMAGAELQRLGHLSNIMTRMIATNTNKKRG